MNCKKCNNIMEKGDLFCTNCGTQVNENETSNNVQEQQGNSSIEEMQYKTNSIGIMEYLKTYMKNPISSFNIFREEVSIQFSLILAAILVAASGLIDIFLTRSVISKVASMMSGGLLKTVESSVRNEILGKLDYIDIFSSGAMNVTFIMGAIFIALEVINAIFVKGTLTHDEILFLSVSSFIPLVLGMAASIILVNVSIILGLLIVIFSLILSFVTLFAGLNEYMEEGLDKAFIVMVILVIILSIVSSVTIANKIGSLKTFVDNIDKIGSFM